jgi:SHS2 domain-containing protein
MPYEFLEHTADVKFRAEGKTLEELFIAAAAAMNETIRGEISILNTAEKIFDFKGKDLEELLYNFLEQFLVLLDSENFLTSQITELKIDRENFSLHAKFVGDNADNYAFTNDVKAVTYSDMKIREENEKFVCEVVLDV